MSIKEPEEIRIGASYRTSMKEYAADPERWEHFAEERLREQIAHLLQKERSEIIKTPEMVEKRVELYVASTEMFWKIVNKEAEKIAARLYGGMR
jgi:hypothetical protein